MYSTAIIDRRVHKRHTSCSGKGNALAVPLSRVDLITRPMAIDFKELEASQSNDTMHVCFVEAESIAKLKRIFMPFGKAYVVLDRSLKNARPYIKRKTFKFPFDCIK
ncbi:hypothetical protein EVAR_13716_1 [Eumeta japonica]|uniref:Uncharacterized protein n=1 Tax=Eumeta variegata TaxID=151549 RepID=A0A4C1UBP5_EUMVA|nr:hypothetical protein EVAR_13716_1 [Eumeta japonica]